jgi:hypothetical protein
VGAQGSVVVKALRYLSEAPGSIPGGATGIFSDISPSDLTMALGVYSAPSENEYQEHSWG